MISYHPLKNGAASAYAKGFKTVDTNDVWRIKKGISQYVWSPCVWKDGVRRQDNFLRADWLVLDFDSGEMKVIDAVNVFCDMVHVIGTTRSHQKEKHGLPPCDRFRVLLLFAGSIHDLRTYCHNVSKTIAKYPADPAPKDGGRFFFPCQKIISVVEDGYTVDIESPPPPEREAARKHYDRVQFERYGKRPPWLEDFLTRGRPCRVGRNQTIYAAAVALRDLGLSQGEAVDLIDQAPFDRRDFSRAEIERTVNSGFARR